MTPTRIILAITAAVLAIAAPVHADDVLEPDYVPPPSELKHLCFVATDIDHDGDVDWLYYPDYEQVAEPGPDTGWNHHVGGSVPCRPILPEPACPDGMSWGSGGCTDQLPWHDPDGQIPVYDHHPVKAERVTYRVQVSSRPTPVTADEWTGSPVVPAVEVGPLVEPAIP